MPAPENALAHDLQRQGFTLRETHISRVFLGETTVYKVKKPVQLGFLDFSTLALRKHFCDAELELNRRLAQDAYLGVVPIVVDARGVHRIDGQGDPVEWAVAMRRLPDHDSAEQRLLDGRLELAHLQQLAERLAAFHAAVRGDAHTAAFGTAATIERNVRENFEQTRSSASRVLRAEEIATIERWQLGFLAAHHDLFERRIAANRVRDGHGDLRLEHCYFDAGGGLEIIDCIEFNERFRYADVCADIAFLSMDLSWHGRHDLSEAFLGYYARAAADYDVYALIDFYESYRAYVRGKVSALLEDDAAAAPDARAKAAASARKYYLLAEACTREPLEKPVLYAVGGMIAAGKTTLAERLSALTHAPVVDADRTRKHLAGVVPDAPLRDAAFAGHYDPHTTEQVYGELLRRAEVVLRSGRSVILDASFKARAHRQAALALCQQHAVPFRFVECVAPDALIRQRLQQRAQAPAVSDGRLDLLESFARSYEAVDELPAEAFLRLDTSQAEPMLVEALTNWLA